MSNSNQKFTFVFANCAGGARGEKCSPDKLGWYLGEQLKDKSKFGEILAIGLSEVVVSVGGKNIPKCDPNGIVSELSPLEESYPYIDDFESFKTGFNLATGLTTEKKFYFSHMNSDNDMTNPEALEKKWTGPDAAERFREQINKHNRIVYQGKAVLLYTDQDKTYSESIQIRPPGDGKTPGLFLGNRDTEPRSAIIIRKLNIPNIGPVDLAFLQLETNSKDPKDRTGTEEELENSLGADNRIMQIDNLCKQFTRNRPVILMGDFNARPGVKELYHLCSKYGFRHVLPIGTPAILKKDSNSLLGIEYTFNQFNDNLVVYCPDYTKSEIEQKWPYSHLKHKVLIDHAFLTKDLKTNLNCESRVIKFQVEDKGKRYSDHRPIALTIEVK